MDIEPDTRLCTGMDDLLQSAVAYEVQGSDVDFLEVTQDVIRLRINETITVWWKIEDLWCMQGRLSSQHGI